MTLQRRKILRAAAGAAALAYSNHFARMLAAQDAPAVIKRDGTRPRLEQGVAAGDVLHDRAITWSRCDRPARMMAKWDTSDRFRDPRGQLGPSVIETADFTGKCDLRDLPAGQRIFYRVQFQDLRDLRNWSEPVVGTLVTPPRPDGPPRDVKIAFTGDVCGQGWGIDLARGGMKMFETMRASEPHLFVHLGDTIYADNPIPEQQKLDDGTDWNNVTTELKGHVAQSL